MPEKITAENLFNETVETIAENVPAQKSVSFVEGDKADAVTSQFKRLFGCQKPIHRLFGGGKSADVLLWRNKKISAGVLAGATAIWVLLEWLDYHLLTLVCFALILGMLALFLWSNVSGLLSRSASKPPRIVVPNDVFVDIGKSVGAEVNQALKFLQDVALGGNLKQFLMVVGSLWAAAIIGGLCNFITVLYIGFVAAHTLPVLYERYEDQVDSFVDQVLDLLQHHYHKLVLFFQMKQGGARTVTWGPDVYHYLPPTQSDDCDPHPTQLLDVESRGTKQKKLHKKETKVGKEGQEGKETTRGGGGGRAPRKHTPTQAPDVQKKLPKKEKKGGKEGQKGKETTRGGGGGRDSSRGAGGSKDKKKNQNHRTGKSDVHASLHPSGLVRH